MKYFAILSICYLLVSCGSPTPKNNAILEPTTKQSDVDTSKSLSLLIEEYEDPDRGNWQSPELVIQKFGEGISEMTIADIGAGTGYFTFRLSRKAKKVIAIDIDERFISYIEERKSELKTSMAENITTRLTKPNHPSIYKEEVDGVLIVNTYLFINERDEYLKKVKRGLKDNGSIVIVDFRMGAIPIGPPNPEKVSIDVVRNELKNNGFRQIDIDSTSLQYQYIVTAK